MMPSLRPLALPLGSCLPHGSSSAHPMSSSSWLLQQNSPEQETLRSTVMPQEIAPKQGTSSSAEYTIAPKQGTTSPVS